MKFMPLITQSHSQQERSPVQVKVTERHPECRKHCLMPLVISGLRTSAFSLTPAAVSLALDREASSGHNKTVIWQRALLLSMVVTSCFQPCRTRATVLWSSSSEQAVSFARLRIANAWISLLNCYWFAQVFLLPTVFLLLPFFQWFPSLPEMSWSIDRLYILPWQVSLVWRRHAAEKIGLLSLQ